MTAFVILHYRAIDTTRRATRAFDAGLSYLSPRWNTNQL